MGLAYWSLCALKTIKRTPVISWALLCTAFKYMHLKSLGHGVTPEAGAEDGTAEATQEVEVVLTTVAGVTG